MSRIDRAVLRYRDLGWTPFPLPARSKFPPPSGITGYNARPITAADYRDWKDDWANIGLVMPDGVIGIDADLYKDGNQEPVGLPATIRSSSRTDGSGIYLFRVPKGTKLQGTVPGLGEVIQHFHRYAVVWPSLHPEGRTYQWLNDYDEEVGVPSINDLPWLPDKWLKRLQDRTRHNGGKGFDGDVDAWMTSLPGGAMSRQVRETLKRAKSELRRYSLRGACRYDTMMRATGRLVSLGAQRHRGVAQAIDEYIGEYLAVMDGEPNRDPAGEIYRAITGAVAKFGVSR